MGTVGFIGLGHMGSGMAANLVKAGHTVRAFDLSAEALDRAAGHGCTAVGSAADAVQGADAVVTMLPAGQHVAEVYRQSVIPGARQGAILIDCSTIARPCVAASPSIVRAVAMSMVEQSIRIAPCRAPGMTDWR